MTIKGLKITSKVLGPLIFISYFKANFSTYKNDRRLKINLLSSSLLCRKESVRKSTGVNLLSVNWIMVHLCRSVFLSRFKTQPNAAMVVTI